MALAEILGALVIATPFAGIAALGAAVVYRTYGARRAAQGLDEMATTDVAGVRTGDGLVRVAGTARATGDDRVSPRFLDAAGVARTTNAWSFEGTERRDWIDESEHVPFVVDDGTGEVPVRMPDGGGFDLDVDRYNRNYDQEEYSVTELPEAAVFDWIAGYDEFERDQWNEVPESHEGVNEVAESVHMEAAYNLTFEEGVIEDGEAVDVVAQPTLDDDGDLVLAPGDHHERFVVTDGGEAALDGSFWERRVGYALGAAVFLFGAGPLVLILAGLAG